MAPSEMAARSRKSRSVVDVEEAASVKVVVAGPHVEDVVVVNGVDVAIAGHETASAELPSESLDKLCTEPMRAAAAAVAADTTGAVALVVVDVDFDVPDGPADDEANCSVAVCGIAWVDRMAIADCATGLEDDDDEYVVSIVGADMVHALTVVARLRCNCIFDAFCKDPLWLAVEPMSVSSERDGGRRVATCCWCNSGIL